MHKEEKIFDTGFRILEVLKLLLNENLTKVDLIKKLSFNDKTNNVYSFEAFIKYFNTLNFMGLKIEKDKNLYILQNALNSVELTSEEKALLIEIIENIDILHNEEKEDIIKNAFCKLSKYINDEKINETALYEIYEKNTQKSNLSVNSNVIASFKSIIKDNQPIKINYLNKNKSIKSIVVEIKEICEKNSNVFIKCFVPTIGRNKNICVESIISVEHIPSMRTQGFVKEPVIFEVYDRLVSLYKLKPSEKVINFQKNCLTISNLEEDKDSLLRRLLKYGENCKIVSPVAVKEEFLSMVDNIMAKLEV